MPSERIALPDGTEIALSHDVFVQVDISDHGDGWLGEHVHRKAGDVAYVVRPKREGRKGTKPRALWMTGQRITIEARITNEGDQGALRAWKAGFLQSVRECTREAHYAGGATRILRLDTTAGPLKDGQEDSIFYLEPSAFEGESLSIEMDDAPNFEAPLKHGTTGAKLVKTAGCDRFSTFPALVKGRTIVTLGRVDWEIAWDGDVRWPEGDRHEAVEWVPAGRFLAHGTVSRNAAVFDLGAAPVHTPFSLDLNEAENYCEYLDGNAWKSSTLSGEPRKNAVAARPWKGEP
ncbi:hypothetical protein LDO32_17845 [Luteimonas sp. Y-2-2-4F]|nr:hypothetical protein [Luteimonas sp. Y-2-2-4F]MCD9033579.1 hypothetical protein [Luteimonas sp. Y-2-2-4F]